MEKRISASFLKTIERPNGNSYSKCYPTDLNEVPISLCICLVYRSAYINITVTV